MDGADRGDGSEFDRVHVADDGTVEVGDRRPKHVSLVTATGERADHGEVYFRHAGGAFVVSSDPAFDPADTTRYPKESLARLEVTQHHSACFITTATAEGDATLDDLRGFRDDVMSRSVPGRALVAVYYAASPPVARTLDRHPSARTTRLVRGLIERCAGLERRRRASDDEGERARLALSLLLHYVVGLAVATVGHVAIRLRERLTPARRSA